MKLTKSNWLLKLRDDILARQALFPGGSSVSLMFFTSEDGMPVATHKSPVSEQIIMPRTHFPAEPGTWHDLVVFTLGRDLQNLELEFIPDNSFTAKFWIVSDMARSGAQLRLNATDIRTGELLATGTVSLDLGTTGIPSPVIITGLYETPAVVPSEHIRITLQVLTPLFGVQVGLISNPPNEVSYISRLISGQTTPTK